MKGSLRALFVSGLVVASHALAPAGATAAPNYPPCWHTPILIQGDAAFTSANGVTGGSGTAADPFVVSGWCISAAGSTGILVRDTTAHYELRGVVVDSGGLGSDHTGIFLWNADNGVVTGSVITGNYDGIFVRDSHDITIVGNDVTENDNDGVFVLSSAAVTIEGNIVWKNRARGIGLHDSENVVITENGVSWNGHETHSDAVYVGHSDHVSITHNNILYNGGSAPPPDPGETVALPPEEGGRGVYLAFASDTRVHHNNLIGNHVQAGEAGTLNFWDDGYPSGGNFWSNYQGADECSGPAQNVCPDPDAIGDTPVPLRLDTNRDHYPLMDPVPGTIFISGSVLAHLTQALTGAAMELDAFAGRLAEAIARLDALTGRDREALQELQFGAEAVLRRLEDYRASAPPLPKWPLPVASPQGSGTLHALVVDLEAIDTQIARGLLDQPDPSRLPREALAELNGMASTARAIIDLVQDAVR